jgi:hypothetical protein
MSPAKATPRDPYAGMNKTEAAYGAHLELLKRAGEIQSWGYETMKLRLADGAFFTVDFIVVNRDGFIEAHEVKGFMREAARVRFLVAREMHPFIFKMVRKTRTGFEELSL